MFDEIMLALYFKLKENQPLTIDEKFAKLEVDIKALIDVKFMELSNDITKTFEKIINPPVYVDFKEWLYNPYYCGFESF